MKALRECDEARAQIAEMREALDDIQRRIEADPPRSIDDGELHSIISKLLYPDQDFSKSRSMTSDEREAYREVLRCNSESVPGKGWVSPEEHAKLMDDLEQMKEFKSSQYTNLEIKLHQALAERDEARMQLAEMIKQAIEERDQLRELKFNTNVTIPELQEQSEVLRNALEQTAGTYPSEDRSPRMTDLAIKHHPCWCYRWTDVVDRHSNYCEKLRAVFISTDSSKER